MSLVTSGSDGGAHQYSDEIFLLSSMLAHCLQMENSYLLLHADEMLRTDILERNFHITG